MQFYSDETRESDPHALSDCEAFELRIGDGTDADRHSHHPDDFLDEDGAPLPEGHYWWSCLPGCLPDGDPSGPFATEALAIADARSTAIDEPGPYILDGSEGQEPLCPNARIIIDPNKAIADTRDGAE